MSDSEVTIGRLLRERIVKLMEQHDDYKKQPEHYKIVVYKMIVVGGDWHIEVKEQEYIEKAHGIGENK
jgi:hypothetical protein